MQDSWVTSPAGLWLQAILVVTAITLGGMIAAYFQNLHEHQFSVFQLLPWILMLWLGSALLLVVFAWLVAWKLPSARYWLIPFAGLLLWAQAAFNVPDYGPLDGAALDWPAMQYLREAALLFIVITLLWLARNLIRRHVLTLLVALLGVQSVYALSAILAADTPMPSASQPPAEIHRLSETENTFLIVLDAFQSDVFAEILERRIGLKETLEGFVFYPDTVGAHPTTSGSLPSMFLGQPYKNKEPFGRYNHRVFSADSILFDLKSAGYQVDILQRSVLPRNAPETYVDHLVSGSTFKSGPRDQFQEALNLLEFTAFRHAPQLIRKLLYRHSTWTLSRLAFQGQLTSAIHRADLELLKNIERHSYTDGTQPVFRFIHFLTPHLPIAFDAELNPRVAAFNRETFTDQAEAAVVMLERFLEVLKAQGVYENSRILVAADHGQGGAGIHGYLPNHPQGNQFADPSSKRAQMIATGLPLLLAKDHGDIGEFKISNLAAHMLDIAPSLIDGINSENTFSGYSLFSVSTPKANRERFFYYYDWAEHSWGSEYLDPVISYRVEGHAWHADSWSEEITRYRPVDDAAQRTRKRPKYTLGNTLDFRAGGNGNPYLGLGWNRPEHERRWTSGKTAEIILPGTFEPDRDYRMRMSVQPFVVKGALEKQRLTIEANGRPIGQYKLSSPSRQQITAVIPAEYVQEDDFRITLITPDHTSPAALGLSHDQRSLAISVTHMTIQ